MHGTRIIWGILSNSIPIPFMEELTTKHSVAMARSLPILLLFGGPGLP